MAAKTLTPTSDLALQKTPGERRPKIPMNLQKLPFALFGIAFALALAMFIFGWMDPWNLVPEYGRLASVAWALLTVLIIVQLIMLAVVAEDSRTRWLNLSLVAVILLMASGLTILSFGILVAPFGIILLAVSLFFLLKSRLTRARSK